MVLGLVVGEIVLGKRFCWGRWVGGCGVVGFWRWGDREMGRLGGGGVGFVEIGRWGLVVVGFGFGFGCGFGCGIGWDEMGYGFLISC